MNTLKLVGVSHLFVVPRIRSSAYVSMLSEAFPALSNSSAGDIQEPSLPDLRHLIVVDNTGDLKTFQAETGDVKCAIDFREVLVWREDNPAKTRVEEIAASLNHDDVINLQFTR